MVSKSSRERVADATHMSCQELDIYQPAPPITCEAIRLYFVEAGSRGGGRTAEEEEEERRAGELRHTHRTATGGAAQFES
jgi:hypothetical protein